MGGMSFRVPEGFQMHKDEDLMISLYGTNGESVFPAKTVFFKDNLISVQFLPLDLQQEMDLINCTIGRADVWLSWSNDRDIDHPWNGLKEIAYHSMRGFSRFGTSIKQYVVERTGHMNKTNEASIVKTIVTSVRAKLSRKGSSTALAILCGLTAVGHHDDVLARAKRASAAATAEPVVAEKLAIEDLQPTSIVGGQKTYNISLKDMVGVGSSVELRGTEGERSFPFTVRSDEVITAAKVKYGIAYSPALLPDLSHIQVLVNNELVSVVPLRETSKGIVREDVIDPRFFADFNQNHKCVCL